MRLRHLDIARGAAVIAMIITHATDGWMTSASRVGAFWTVRKLIAVLPLPSFLLLAGAGLSLRVASAEAKREDGAAVRGSLVRRGLGIVLAGYALNLALALIDGGLAGLHNVARILRFDVLQCIGASLALLALTGVATLPSRRRLLIAATALGGLTAVICIPLHLATGGVTGWQRYLIAPLVAVPGISPMPMVPLLCWMALGVVLTPLLSRERTARAYLLGTALAVATAALAAVAMAALARLVPGPMDRTHPAIYANLVDLGARAVALTFCGGLLVRMFSPASLAFVSLLGSYSLFAYAFHLPLCYGRIPSSFARSLTAWQVVVPVLLLIALTYAATWLRARWASK